MQASTCATYSNHQALNEAWIFTSRSCNKELLRSHNAVGIFARYKYVATATKELELALIVERPAVYLGLTTNSCERSNADWSSRRCMVAKRARCGTNRTLGLQIVRLRSEIVRGCQSQK
eukprot:TRINITY_DN72277_c0_g1_i1.p1 TRINITY_DN72277_c0_g1~~TRINITY_DN72277_c0_g1_i1.p1  ORF type:complete len:119 (+),score=1.51 TRINITY_DN72277_c0_g1_i1:57-413(+)